MDRRTILTTTGGLLTTIAGCQGRLVDGAEPDPSTDETQTEPAYTTCTGESVPSTVPDSARDPPETLTTDRIIEYVDQVERDFVLPADGNGYVKIGEITIEPTTHGYIARVPVNGGYFNRQNGDNSTETVHYDLGTHVGSYFLTERVVRRVRASGTAVDPRQQGQVIACSSG